MAIGFLNRELLNFNPTCPRLDQELTHIRFAEFESEIIIVEDETKAVTKVFMSSS